MISILLSHQWKSFWRSRSASKGVAVQIFVGIIVLYFLGCATALGFAFSHLLHHFYPGQDIIPIFCGFILYYFSFDVLLRFLGQDLPVLSIQPYLGLNVRRQQLMNFLNLRSLFHFLNLLPLLLFLPFTFTVIMAGKGVFAAGIMTVSLILLTAFNNFLILYLKRKSIISIWGLVLFFLLVVGFIVLDYFHLISFRSISSRFFTALLDHPWLITIPIALSAGSYLNNYRFLMKNLYLDDMSKATKGARSKEYTWLQQWGLTGDLIALNIKLISRNKRPKYIFRFGVVLLFYGFLFYNKQNLKDHSQVMVLFGALFVTGAFNMNYGQFLFSWHSSYFQRLMTANFSISSFIRAQLIFMITVSTFSFLLCTLYGFISWKILPIQLAAWLWNIGANTIFSAYFATYSYKAVDISQGTSFNYQGTGPAQWLNVLGFLLLPLAIFVPLNIFFGLWVSCLALGLLGAISLLLFNWWIGFLTNQFQLRKYRILEGFREI